MEETLQALQGTVARVIYENSETGYTVFELAADGELHAVAGIIGEVHEGESVTVYGTFGEHKTYGFQFQAQSCETAVPQDLTALQVYLSSGALPYIGAATARKIIDRFGMQTLDIIASDPEQLTFIRGITSEKARAIQHEFQRMFGVREAITWLGRFGISPSRAVEVFRHLGPATVDALTQNPYLLCGEPLQMRFTQVDKIAAELQLGQDSELRVSAALLYTLRLNAGNGHTCLPRIQLVTSVARFLGVEPERVDRQLSRALEEDEVRSLPMGEREFIFLPDLLCAEQDIAARLRDLAAHPAQPPRDVEINLQALERGQGFSYAPAQREAIRMAVSSRVMVLTGGPGTGKTTTVNAIIALLEHQGERVSLCAPTGRAAKRLEELTGHRASTIHRLLEVDYTGGVVRFIHNEKNLLRCDAVILDEMSMVDVKLFQSLLAALRVGCRIIMVGDANQLPSVGPGNILGEVLRACSLPTVCLNEIFRQAAKSLIVSNAHRIVEGEPLLNGGKDDDFFMIEADGAACQQLVCDLVCTRLPRRYGFDPIRDIQVLCPTKIGPVGTVELNKQLQQRLNPPRPGLAQIETAGRVFRVGDKVMQVRNNYDIPFERDGGETGVGAYNGDVGIVAAIDPAQGIMRVQMDDRCVTYGQENLAELEIAYAVTVHKSQGNEFPAVVLPTADVPEKLRYRNLFYTGVTRARSLCVIPGRRAMVSAMVANVRQNMRYSALGWLLSQEISG